MKLFIKGIIIGIGKILPGISGAVIAVSFGVYNKLINIISQFPKINKKDLTFILQLGLGILTSIIFISQFIVKLLDTYYSAIILLFTVLITISIIKTMKQINYRNYKNITIFLLGFFVLILINTLNIYKLNSTSSFYIYFIIGIIEALTSIIPGLSGTAIFILLGLYDTYLLMIANIINIKYLINNMFNTFCFFLGLILTFIIMAKIITYLFNKYKEETTSLIQGLLLASVFSILNTLY